MIVMYRSESLEMLMTVTLVMIVVFWIILIILRNGMRAKVVEELKVSTKFNTSVVCNTCAHSLHHLNNACPQLIKNLHGVCHCATTCGTMRCHSGRQCGTIHVCNDDVMCRHM